MDVLKWKNLVSNDKWFHLSFLPAVSISGKIHKHDFCEIFITAAAGLIHHINGQQLELAANTLVLIRPDDAHYFKSTRQAAIDKEILLNLAFPAIIVKKMRKRLFPEDRNFWGGAGELPALFSLTEYKRMELWNEATKLMHVRPSRFELECFLLNLLKATGYGSTGHDEDVPAWLQQACTKIKEPQNLRNGLDKFYSLCGKCREHISRQLKQHYGISPVEFISGLRIEYAARMLSDTSMSLDEIAMKCGFQNLNYFFTAFKKHYSTTPRKYRMTKHAGNRIV
jgi:AraC family cel operon transcriptional repressor